MTIEEAKNILINRGFVEINGDQVFDGNKWRNAIAVISKWLEQEPCEDCISREAVNDLVDELARAISDERCCISRGRSTATIMQDILDLPSVTPKEKTGKYDKLKEAVGKIKAEIKAYDKKDRYPYGALGVSTALKIIDNHTEGLI